MMRYNSQWHSAMARSYLAIRSPSSVVTALYLPQPKQKVSSPKTPSIMPCPTRFQDILGDGASGFWLISSREVAVLLLHRSLPHEPQCRDLASIGGAVL